MSATSVKTVPAVDKGLIEQATTEQDPPLHPFLQKTALIRIRLSSNRVVDPEHYRTPPESRSYPCISVLTFELWRSHIIPFLTADQDSPLPDVHLAISSLSRTCRAIRFIVERDACWVSIRRVLVEKFELRRANLSDEEKQRRHSLYYSFFYQHNKVEEIVKWLDECDHEVPLFWPLESVKKRLATVFTPGFLACQMLERERLQDTVRRLEVLRKAGAICRNGEPFVRYAASRKAIGMADYFYKEWGCSVDDGGFSDGVTALHAACDSGDLKMVEWLLERKARTDIPTYRAWKTNVLEGETVMDLLQRRFHQDPQTFAPVIAVFSRFGIEIPGVYLSCPSQQ